MHTDAVIDKSILSMNQYFSNRRNERRPRGLIRWTPDREYRTGTGARTIKPWQGSAAPIPRRAYNPGATTGVSRHVRLLISP
jgi:hypothetical protein